MAFARRSYKKTASTYKPKPATRPAFKKPSTGTPAETAAGSAPQRRPYGGGYQQKQQQGQGGDNGFIRITGMFPAKSGSGSFQVFLKPEHVEALQSLQEGDSLGFTPPREDKEYAQLWARKADQ